MAIGKFGIGFSSKQCGLRRALKPKLYCNSAAWLLLLGLIACRESEVEVPAYDVIIRGGTVYDGSGAESFVADVAIRDGRIAAIGTQVAGTAGREITADGLAVAPGFINILSWAGEPLLVDGRAQSDLRQGVTTEVIGEGISLGPLTPAVRAEYIARQTNLEFDLPWMTLGEALEFLENKGIAVNVASYVGAATVRMNVLGTRDTAADAVHLEKMRELVKNAMEQGALGVASSLIYAPGTYADTSELVALAEEAGRCGGIYASHIRNESDRILEAVGEAIEIGRRSGTPVEIFHLKIGGRQNWHRLEDVVTLIDSARDRGQRITTDMYAYPASSTGLDASMPDWVQEGGVATWIENLKDPNIRRRVVSEMQAPASDWENAMRAAGGGRGVLLVEFRNPELKRYIGRSVADIAMERGTSAEETIIDLVIEDGSRPRAIYFTMSEENLIRKMRLPYMSFASDGRALSAEGVFLENSEHPRSYGNFARVLGRYVREQKRLSLSEAIYRMSGLPAKVLSLPNRGFIREGYAADLVVFDPDSVQDHATYEQPHQYATGISHVLVNGIVALANGEPTSQFAGKFVRGRAWTGWPDGGCRAAANDWHWHW